MTISGHRGDRIVIDDPWPAGDPGEAADRFRAACRQISTEGAIVVMARMHGPPAWPAEVAVPLRPIKGLRDAPEGTEEGDLCVREYQGETCLGRLELRARASLGGCTCWQCAPCSSCMSSVPECQRCGHREPEPL